MKELFYQLSLLREQLSVTLTIEELIILHFVYFKKYEQDDIELMRAVNAISIAHIRNATEIVDSLLKKDVFRKKKEDYIQDKKIMVASLEINAQVIEVLYEGNKKEMMWELVIDKCPKVYLLNNHKLSQRFPLSSTPYETEEDMINAFWKICNYGEKSAVKSFFKNLELYQISITENFHISQFLQNYRSCVKAIKDLY